MRHCPSQCTHHRPPDPVRTGAAPGAGAAGTRRSLSPSHGQRPRGGGHEQGVPQGCVYPTPVPTPSPTPVPTPGGHPVTRCPGLLAGPPKGDIARPLRGRPHAWAPSCGKSLHSGFQSLGTCRGWAPGPGPQELVNLIQAARADEAQVARRCLPPAHHLPSEAPTGWGWGCRRRPARFF